MAVVLLRRRRNIVMGGHNGLAIIVVVRDVYSWLTVEHSPSAGVVRQCLLEEGTEDDSENRRELKLPDDIMKRLGF